MYNVMFNKFPKIPDIAKMAPKWSYRSLQCIPVARSAVDNLTLNSCQQARSQDFCKGGHDDGGTVAPPQYGGLGA